MNFDNIPRWVWIGGGVLLVGIVFLMSQSGGSASSGTTTSSTGMPATDVNDILSQLQDAADQLGSGVSAPGDTTGGGNVYDPNNPSGFTGNIIPVTPGPSGTNVFIPPGESGTLIQVGPTPTPTNTTTTKTVTNTVTEKSLWGKDIGSKVQRLLSSESAATLFKKYHVSYGTKINQGDLKRLFRKMGKSWGKSLTYSDLVRVGVVAENPTTTKTTTTVQTSNNAVA